MGLNTITKKSKYNHNTNKLTQQPSNTKKTPTRFEDFEPKNLKKSVQYRQVQSVGGEIFSLPRPRLQRDRLAVHGLRPEVLPEKLSPEARDCFRTQCHRSKLSCHSVSTTHKAVL